MTAILGIVVLMLAIVLTLRACRAQLVGERLAPATVLATWASIGFAFVLIVAQFAQVGGIL